jgi:hypothetical protein
MKFPMMQRAAALGLVMVAGTGLMFAQTTTQESSTTTTTSSGTVPPPDTGTPHVSKYQRKADKHATQEQAKAHEDAAKADKSHKVTKAEDQQTKANNAAADAGTP